MSQTINITADVMALQDMSQAELEAKWEALYGHKPRSISQPVMIKNLAYRLQELYYEQNVSGAVRSMLKQQAKELYVDKRRLQFRPGTELIRAYKGVEHRVRALDDGTFQYGNRKYRSLTRIAFEITGTKWSGPTFFGVDKHVW